VAESADFVAKINDKMKKTANEFFCLKKR